jgi:uncharacterized repeat protein (TIGR01451 family)
MNNITLKLSIGLMAIGVGLFILIQQSTTLAAANYHPPDYITVWVYHLEDDGSLHPDDHLCSYGDTFYGCTFYFMPGYPYSMNPIAISIEDDYLLDVVPSELPPIYHLTALRAQAIAARSYAYYHILHIGAVDNSTDYQLFIPFAYENWPTSQQQLISTAVAPRHYLSYPDTVFRPAPTPTLYYEDAPAFAEFSADVWTSSITGGKPYLLSVEDPISTACDANTVIHGHGLSQEGASRWARGHECSYTNLTATPYPGNSPGTSWSVSWTSPEQILFHYYTGVQLRDAANGNQILSPSFRWNPLSITWANSASSPPTMHLGGTSPVTMYLQNTGLYDWTCDSTYTYYLFYEWQQVSPTESSQPIPHTPEETYPSACGVLKGDESLLSTFDVQVVSTNYSPGMYFLRFDIARQQVSAPYQVTYFSDYGWPTYDVLVCVDCYRDYLPAVVEGPGAIPTHPIVPATSTPTPSRTNTPTPTPTPCAQQYCPADLSLTLTANTPFQVNQVGTYQITVINHGPFSAANFSIVDTLPKSLTFVSASGPGWFCNLNQLTLICNHAGPINVGQIGANTTITITVRPRAEAVPSVTNMVTVSYPNDPNPLNNQQTLSTTVLP